MEATCTEAAQVSYTCSVCQDSYTETVGAPKGHTPGEDQQVAGQDCTYCPVCTVCDQPIVEKAYTRHSYNAVVTQEADCCNSGLKTNTCSVCGDTQEPQVISAIPDAHKWDAGAEQENTIVYTCTVENCGATKNVVNLKTETKAEVSNETLQDVGQVELMNATLALDETVKEQLTDAGEVTLAVDTIQKEELPLTQEQMEQIKGNTVYDFTMEDEQGNAVDFNGGKVTVTVPYTLDAQEDVDAITIWYIADNGELEEVEGCTYSNGYVTFEVEHFSYYSVTRMTPAERCEKYGHLTTTKTVEVTCDADGYVLTVCSRCGNSEKTNVVTALGHSYSVVEEQSVVADCVTDGKTVYACGNCGGTYETKTNALGHSWQIQEQVAATCEQAGKTVSKCDTCGTEETKVEAQLPHTYTSQIVAPDCEVAGYTLHTCICGVSYQDQEVPATGHRYDEDSVQWSWDGLEATLTLSCTKNADHQTAQKAAVVAEKVTEADCSKAGATTYKATVSVNGVVYTDRQETVIPQSAHKVGTVIENNNSSHYFRCLVCDSKVNVQPHTYGEQEVIKEATCATHGVANVACEDCGYAYEKDILPKGHTIINGKCTECDFIEALCMHNWIRQEQVDVAKDLPGVCGLTISYGLCECGQYQLMPGVNATPGSCGTHMTYEEEDFVDENGLSGWITTETCTKCGVKVVRQSNYVPVDAATCTYQQVVTFTITLGDQQVRYEFKGAEREHPYVVMTEIPVEDDSCCTEEIYLEACPCGENASIWTDGQCFPDWENTNEYSGWTCMECGAQYREEMLEPIPTGNPCEVEHPVAVTLKNAAGETLVELTAGSVGEEHEDLEITATLLVEGGSCEDGVYVTGKCSDCGLDVAYRIFYHEVLFDEVEHLLVDNDVCPMVKRAQWCPCGEIHEVHIETQCDWEQIGFESTENGSVERFSCSECGLIRENNYESTLDRENCTSTETQTTRFILNGEVVYTLEDTWENENHDIYAEEAILLGDSCEDGYQVLYACRNCDYSYTSGYQYEHYTEFGKEYNLADYGMCGGVMIQSSCACGAQKSYYTEEPSLCSWRHLSGDENSVTQICTKCGVIRENGYTGGELEGCRMYESGYYEYRLGYDVLLKIERYNVWENHDIDYDVELLGDSCEDGFKVSGVCKDCGEPDNWSGRGHQMFLTEEYTGAEYGFCEGGWLRVDQCPCGQSSDLYWNLRCMFFVENHQETEDGYTSTEICRACGMVWDTTSQRVPMENCRAQETNTHTFTLDGEQILQTSSVRTVDNHAYEMSYNLLGDSCEDGVEITETCTVCGETYSHTQYYHEMMVTEEIDLTDMGYCSTKLRWMECPCGENRGTGHEGSSCRWMWVDENYQHGENGDYISEFTHVCEICGMKRIRTVDHKVLNSCAYQETATWTYLDAEDNVLGEFSDTDTYETHDCIYELSLQPGATNCNGGMIAVGTCRNCGKTVTETRYNCDTFLVEETDLSDYGLCGGMIRKYACACGNAQSYDVNYSGCEWDFEGTDRETNTRSDVCEICGAHRKTREVQTGEKDEDCMIPYTEEVWFYNASNQQVGYVQRNFWRTMHQYVYNMSAVDGDCKNGYTVEMSCADCSYHMVQTGTDHTGYRIDAFSADQYGMCSGEIAMYSCACGKRQWPSFNSFNCNFQTVEELENGRRERCEACGTERVMSISRQKITECEELYTEHYTYYNAQGQELFGVIDQWSNTYHDYFATSLTLLPGATDCMGGYAVDMTCKRCGYRQTGQYTSNHSVYTIEQIDLEAYGMCTGLLEHQKCACGAQDFWSDENGCNFQMNGGQNLCVHCGAERVFEEVYTPVDACHKIATRTISFFMDGQYLTGVTSTAEVESHLYVYQYADTNAENCERNDIQWTQSCYHCGKTETGTTRGHSSNIVAVYDVAKYGMCGNGYMTKRQCACGYNGGWSYYELEDGCQWQYLSSDGNSQRDRCSICGTVRTRQETVLPKDENCYLVRNYTYTYERDGQLLLQETYTDCYYDHNYQVTEVTMEGQTCEDGVSYTQVCADCGAVTNYHTTGHEMLMQDVYDIQSMGGCVGSQIIRHSCPCGQRSSLSDHLYNCSTSYSESEYEDDQGHRHIMERRQCEKCGLVVSKDWYEVRDPSTCTALRYTNVAISMADQAIDAFAMVDKLYDNHDYVYTYEFTSDEKDCEKGAVQIATCRDCDYRSEWNYSHHYKCTEEVVADLSDYGSVCGGFLMTNRCLCGEEKDTYFNTACDAQSQWQSMEKEDYNAIGIDVMMYVEEQQDHNGTFDPDWSTSAYIYVCSVTDPNPCGLAYRVLDYYIWDEENCEAIQYRTYHLGYDRENDTWEAEHTVELSRRPYHSYVVENSNTENEDGTYTYVSTSTCTVCGGSYSNTSLNNANGNTLEQNIVLINPSNSAEVSRWERNVEYIVRGGYSMQTLRREDFIYRDGSTYWSQSEYTHNPDNCEYVQVWTDSNGRNEEYTGDHHNSDWHYETIWEGTCSQPAYMREQEICNICQNVVDEDYYYSSPRYHSFNYCEDESGNVYYVCSVCGLESVTGGNGSVTLEDMTVADSDVYTIGYFVQSYNQTVYSHYISILDPNGEEILLDGIELTIKNVDEHGENTITFSKATTDALAAELAGQAGWTEYDLRLTFRPDDLNELDYSITLTDTNS